MQRTDTRFRGVVVHSASAAQMHSFSGLSYKPIASHRPTHRGAGGDAKDYAHIVTRRTGVTCCSESHRSRIAGRLHWMARANAAVATGAKHSFSLLICFASKLVCAGTCCAVQPRYYGCGAVQLRVHSNRDPDWSQSMYVLCIQVRVQRQVRCMLRNACSTLFCIFPKRLSATP